MIKTAPALAPNEQFRFEQCEKAIERGLKTFVEVGRALTEIRDNKLYRIGFKTFEAYCKDRWEIGRSRAYELIDQAKVVDAVYSGEVILSAVADISKRDVRAIKDDLPAISTEIQARIKSGEEPGTAIATVVKNAAQKVKAEKAASQSINDAATKAILVSLPPSIQAAESAKAAAIEARKSGPAAADQDPNFPIEGSVGGLTAVERIAELEEILSHQDATVSRLERELEKFKSMKALFDKGGFEAVVAGKEDEIHTLKTRVSAESRDKVTWMEKANFWREQAIKLGWKPKDREQSAPLDNADTFYDVIDERA